MLQGYSTPLEEGPGGRPHRKPMDSPEFQGFKPFRDTNYNLALLRWLVRSVNEVSEHTGTGTEPFVPHGTGRRGHYGPRPCDGRPFARRDWPDSVNS